MAELGQTYEATDPAESGQFDPIPAGWYAAKITQAELKTEEIGRQQLGALIGACGIPSVKDTDQLIGGTCQIKATVKYDDTYGPSNEVKGFKSLEGSAPPQPKPKSGGTDQAPAGNGKPKPPWMK